MCSVSPCLGHSLIIVLFIIKILFIIKKTKTFKLTIVVNHFFAFGVGFEPTVSLLNLRQVNSLLHLATLPPKLFCSASELRSSMFVEQKRIELSQKPCKGPSPALEHATPNATTQFNFPQSRDLALKPFKLGILFQPISNLVGQAFCTWGRIRTYVWDASL